MMLIFVLSPASGTTSVLPETNLPESHLHNSVPFCSEDYDKDTFHQTENESSTSLCGCGSFEDNEIVFTRSYAEFVSHSSSNLRGNPEEDDNVGTEDHDHYGIAPIETRRSNMQIIFQKS